MRLFTVWTLTTAAVLSSCTHTNEKTDQLADPSSFEDEIALRTSKTPEFCNPQGKTGADLTHCQAINDGISQDLEDAAKKREPWFNFTKAEWTDNDLIADGHVVKVKNDKLTDAITALQSAEAVELTQAEYDAYTGLSSPALKPFLVRALAFESEPGTFQVFQKNGELFIRHDAMGKEGTPEKRMPLIVLLKAKPKQVYVDCQIGE